MRREREIELAFSPEVKMAQFREVLDRMRWEQTERLRRMSRVAIPTIPGMPRFPERKFRRHPNFVYVLAREAYEQYQKQELFLKYLGVEIVEANENSLMRDAAQTQLERMSYVLDATDVQLRVALDPRGNNRRKWWLEDPKEAREWLRKQIEREVRRWAKRQGYMVEAGDEY